jgi:hypothetical protein
VKTITEGLRQEARGAKVPLRVSAISPGEWVARGPGRSAQRAGLAAGQRCRAAGASRWTGAWRLGARAGGRTNAGSTAPAPGPTSSARSSQRPLARLPPATPPHPPARLPSPQNAGIVETEFFSVRAFGDPEAAKRATSAFKCLEPADVAAAMVWCLSAPPHVEVDDVVVRPTEQLI